MLRTMVNALGRIALSLIFILSAVYKFMNWSEAEQSLTNTFTDLMGAVQQTPWLLDILAFLLPWLPVLLGIGAIVELIGGLLLFLGLKVRLGALLLLLFLIPSTFFFHHFWVLEGAEKQLQMTMFLKNLSIFGGLLVVLALGKGRSASADSDSAIH